MPYAAAPVGEKRWKRPQGLEDGYVYGGEKWGFPRDEMGRCVSAGTVSGDDGQVGVWGGLFAGECVDAGEGDA